MVSCYHRSSRGMISAWKNGDIWVYTFHSGVRTMAGPASGGVQRWSIMRVICAIGARCSRCDAIRRPEIVPPRNITDAHVRPLRYPARVSRASVHSCSSLRVIYPFNPTPSRSNFNETNFTLFDQLYITRTKVLRRRNRITNICIYMWSGIIKRKLLI